MATAVARWSPAASRLSLRLWIAATAIYLLVAFDLAAVVSVKQHLRSQEAQSPLFTAALTALSRSPSVRVTGTTSLHGAPVALDVVAGQAAGGGSVAIGPAICDVVLDGETLYVKASALTWEQLGYAADASHLDNRWWRTSASAQPFRTLAQFVNVGSLASVMKATPTLVGRPATTIDGIRVTPLSAANRSGTTFYVTMTGGPIVVAERQTSEFMRLDEYGTARPPPVPAAAIPLNSLLSSQEP